jgi:hypothetical protein
MMRAMPGFHPALAASADDASRPQGSSGTKVLADYAAMSAAEHTPTHQNASVPTSLSKEDGVKTEAAVPLPREIGGREGPEPTRFGDWEKSGRCIDF